MNSKATSIPSKTANIPSKTTKTRKRKAPVVTGVNKEWLIQYLADQHQYTKVDAGEIVKRFINALMAGVKENSKLSLIGFGSFIVQQRAEREGRNPSTGETITIRPYKQITFKAGSEFKNHVQS